MQGPATPGPVLSATFPEARPDALGPTAPGTSLFLHSLLAAQSCGPGGPLAPAPTLPALSQPLGQVLAHLYVHQEEPRATGSRQARPGTATGQGMPVALGDESGDKWWRTGLTAHVNTTSSGLSRFLSF